MYYADLTHLEKQVFDLLIDDYTVQQIAHALDLWPYEVQDVINSLKQKLGTR